MPTIPRSLRALALVLLAAAPCACGSGGGSAEDLALLRVALGDGGRKEFHGVPTLGPPQRAATATVTNQSDFQVDTFFDVATDVAAPQLDPGSVAPSQSEASLAPGESITVDMLSSGMNWRQATLTVRAGAQGSAPTETHEVTVENGNADAVESLGEGMTGFHGTSMAPNASVAGNDPICDETTHSNGILSVIPAFFTDIILFFAARQNVSREVGRMLFFPPGTDTLELAPDMPLAATSGEHYHLFLGVDGDIPQANPVQQLQFGCVFDQDGNTSNNYVPPAAFPNDYFRDTDRWYEVRYDPTNGWSLRVTDATGNAFTEIASAARVLVTRRGIHFLIPVSEISSPTARYRLTAFAHEGDFGLNPPHVWSANTSPRMADPMHQVPKAP